jgi:hypothetical protein
MTKEQMNRAQELCAEASVEAVLRHLDDRARNVFDNGGRGYSEEETRYLCHRARDTLSALSASQAALVERIKKYRAKLEVDHHFVSKAGGPMERVELPFGEDEPYDGIDCRNETIKLQDEQIAKLKARAEAAEASQAATGEAEVDRIAKLICGHAAVDECNDAESYFAAATHHSGDCTKECHTCILCRVELFRDLARQVIAAHAAERDCAVMAERERMAWLYENRRRWSMPC